jgi:hypothetical protein
MLIDIVDNVVFFLSSTYCLTIVIMLCVFKLAILIWYKPHRLSFARKHYFTIYFQNPVSDREINNHKWPFFKKMHNLLTVLTYSFFALWLLMYLLINVVKG